MALQYPLNIRFKVISLAEQVSVSDANDNELFFVKQKLFKLKEKIEIFRDKTKSELLYTLQADRVLDWSPEYTLAGADGKAIGTIKREGAKSLWRASYHAHIGGKHVAHVHEMNPWAKVLDGIIGEIPIVGLISNYLFHPKYAIDSPDGKQLGVIEKQPALFEGKFVVTNDKLSDLDDDTEQHLMVLIMVVTLLERSSG